MLGRDTSTITRTCPDCGGKLVKDRELFRCEEHGAFFPYGPQLLVRAPRPVARLSETLMPWESQAGRVPR